VDWLSQHGLVYIPCQLLFLLRLNRDRLIEVVKLRLVVAFFFLNHNRKPHLVELLLIHGVDHFFQIHMAHLIQVRLGVDRLCLHGNRLLHAGQFNRVHIADVTAILSFEALISPVILKQLGRSTYLKHRHLLIKHCSLRIVANWEQLRLSLDAVQFFESSPPVQGPGRIRARSAFATFPILVTRKVLQHRLLRLVGLTPFALVANQVAKNDDHVDQNQGYDENDQRNTEVRVFGIQNEVEGMQAAQEHDGLVELLQSECLLVYQGLLDN